jgi:hypothetical protein
LQSVLQREVRRFLRHPANGRGAGRETGAEEPVLSIFVRLLEWIDGDATNTRVFLF